MEQKIILNVGGVIFATLRDTLKNVPGTRLADLDQLDESYDATTSEYFFDRNPDLFGPVLDYYRHGELHFSHCLCGPAIRKELQFWGIDENCISTCCWRAYKAFDDEKATIEELEKILTSNENALDAPDGSAAAAAGGAADGNPDGPSGRGSCRAAQRRSWLATCRDKLWTFLDKPQSSKIAQAWTITISLLILLSIAVVCMETHPMFRVPKNATADSGAAASNTTNPKTLMYFHTQMHPALWYIDFVLILVFSVELLLRFASCPCKLRFFKSPFNIIDIFCVVPLLVVLLLQQLDPDIWSSSSMFVVISYLSLTSVLRVFRLFKLARHYRGLKILRLAIRSSMQELVLLFMLIFMGMLIFSTLIYFAEYDVEDNFPHIPIGFWWSIITMTTVGYGDIHPKAGWGYLVGSVCGICGMLITGLPIPIIASNFNHFYNYAALGKKMRDKVKSNRTVWQQRSRPGSTVATPPKSPTSSSGHASSITDRSSDAAPSMSSERNVCVTSSSYRYARAYNNKKHGSQRTNKVTPRYNSNLETRHNNFMI